MSKTEPKRRAPSLARLPRDVQRAVAAARDKKALDVVVLDLRKVGGFTDFFVMCSGTNVRQVQAIADAVHEALESAGARPAHVEGYERAQWVLLDYFDLIVHVFSPETRIFYGLERLWGSADRVEIPDDLQSS